MQISGLGSIQPYYYNLNMLSADSLNKVAGISENLNSRKTDFSGLTQDASTNENPLKMGQSSNFMDIFYSQMALSQTNQSRIMTSGGDSTFSQLSDNTPLDPSLLENAIPKEEQPSQEQLLQQEKITQTNFASQQDPLSPQNQVNQQLRDIMMSMLFNK